MHDVAVNRDYRFNCLARRLSSRESSWHLIVLRIAILSDIHGNIAALDAVLADVDRQGVEARARGADAPLILCGHTHIPRIHHRPGGGMIVNPGSVGLPAYDDVHPVPHKVETGSPHARYAVAERKDGIWHASLIALPYDWEAVAHAAEMHNRPEWAAALRTGYV